MSAEASLIGTDAISFLNRDHIVLVTINQAEVVVTTTLGLKISVPASAATLARFVDELANAAESNFVSIASTVVPLKSKDGEDETAIYR